MGRAPPGSRLQDRPPAADLHGPDHEPLRADGQALTETGAEALSQGPAHYWIVDRVIDAVDEVLPSALVVAAGCYTTARVTDGEPSLADYHCRRLRRDAAAIGLAPPRDAAILAALSGLARAEFGSGTGIVQLRAVPDASGACVLIGTPRPIGDAPSTWRAVTAPFPHPGPGDHPGAKLTHRALYARARDHTREADVDESLLYDADGRLVEGARSNCLIVDAGGRLVGPELRLGAVAGIALERLGDGPTPIGVATLRADDVAAAREVIAVNAVRGACAIVEIDGRPVADGRAGPCAAALAAELSRA